MILKATSLLLILLISGTILQGCIKTAPAGEGSTDENGTPRDPSQILPVGIMAPDFVALDEQGNTVNLASFRGEHNVVLIFYPANETPGCTRQLCAARDSWQEYVDRNILVFGVNPGTAESHQAFRANHAFPFPLISDTSGEVIRSFGARGPMGVTTRTVYGIDKAGRIVFAERGIPATEAILAAFDTTGE